MFDPLRRLKYLPWIELLQIALVTILIMSLVDWLLSKAIELPAIYTMVARLLSSPFGFLLFIGIAVGIGALAVAIAERWFRHVILSNSSLWALVPCLALWLWLRSLLPDQVLPQLITPPLAYVSLVGMIVGVFWKGRPYWR